MHKNLENLAITIWGAKMSKFKITMPINLSGIHDVTNVHFADWMTNRRTDKTDLEPIELMSIMWDKRCLLTFAVKVGTGELSSIAGTIRKIKDDLRIFR